MFDDLKELYEIFGELLVMTEEDVFISEHLEEIEEERRMNCKGEF